MKGFYFITDSSLSKAGNFSDVQAALKAGACAIQYRNKTASERVFLEEARALKALCIDSGAPFIVNDCAEVALAVGADGVHVGQGDLACGEARRLLGARAVVGVSTHSVEEALAAERGGATYLSVGPVFGTTTKKDAWPTCGVRLITEIKAASKLPVVAIGGITLENAGKVIAAGADVVAAISATVSKQDVFLEVKRFNELFK